jgi:hypothetical protein
VREFLCVCLCVFTFQCVCGILGMWSLHKCNECMMRYK